jgi:two-component system, OmpR family, sensor histidine kinase KdpD
VEQRNAARRTGWGTALAVIGPAVATAALLPVRSGLSLASVTLLFLLPVVATAAVGGVRPALAGAVAADLLLNFFFVPPYHTLVVDRGDNLIALIVYVVVAAAVAVAVDTAARNRAAAARRTVEAALLASATSEPVAGNSLSRLLEQVRISYRMDTVALADADGGTLERVGPPPSGPPSLATDAGSGLRLLAWGPPVFAEDRGALGRLAVAAARTVENQRMADEAARARELAQIDRVRSALLGAVGHDLRTPLAGIKAAISSLRQPDLTWDPEDEAELLATVEESTDRLSDLVENLLSLSRLQAGALSVEPRPVPLDAVVAQALLHTPTGGTTVDIEVPDDLPLAYADPGLLERVVANLVDNAAKASRTVLVSGRADGDRVELRIVDHGPGIPVADRERIFTPFQRLDDHAGGLGLGLAIARGFTEAMDGTLSPSDTPDGGLTMTITLPVAP